MRALVEDISEEGKEEKKRKQRGKKRKKDAEIPTGTALEREEQ